MKLGSKKLISFNAPVTLWFIIICTISLFLDSLTNGISNLTMFSVYRSDFRSPIALFRLFGHVIGHVDLEHYVGNMTYILLLGPLLEEKYGKWVIIDVIVITALITGLLHVLIFSDVMLLGASGVVFAMIMLSSITSIRENSIPITFVLMAVLYIGQEVYSALFVVDNVSNLTHIVGGVIGSMSGYYVSKSKAIKGVK